MPTKRFICVSALMLLVPAALAQTAAAKSKDTLKLLDQRVPEVSFEQAPFDQVMEWVQQTMGINVVVRWQTLVDAGVARDKPISIRVRNVRLSQALWMIMNEAGGSDLKLAYRASGNVLVLSTAEDLGQEMIVKTYDVSDLLVRVRNFQGPSIDLTQIQQQSSGQGGGGSGQSVFQGGGGQNQQNIFAEQNQNQQGDNPEMLRLVKLITDTIEPDSWTMNGGKGTISPFGKQIVVRNNIFVHQRLGGYIEEGT